MYQGGVYGAGPPMYGMYGFDPRVAEAGQPRSRSERETTPIKFTEGKLFIGGVEASIITKEDLVEYCSQWGEVSDAVVMDRKGYGFVTFADPKAAMKFLEKRVHELKGRRLDAKAAVPKAHLGTAKLTKKMFVGGTGELTDQDFKDHFSQFGDIEDAAVVRREGQSRGFGFVTFADEISVEKCLLVNHYIKNRKVELKRAVPKDEVMAAQGLGVFGYPPGAYPNPQPGMMQQQFYPMPYGPAGPPSPYGMRPGFPPGPAGMPVAGDPYGWYSMGYMPYYPGMYPTPYGMMPQPGMAPYPGMPYPGMQGPAGMPGARMQQQQQLGGPGAAGSSAGHAEGGAGRSRGEAGSSSGGGGSRGGGGGGSSGMEAGAGTSSQQQGAVHAASPAGPSSSPDPSSGYAGLRGGPPGVRRVGSDPAAGGASSSKGGSSSGAQQPPGILLAGGGSGAGASTSSSSSSSRQPRGPHPPGVVSYPGMPMRPAAGGPGSAARAMGPGIMPFAAAAAGGGVVPPGAGLTAGLPGPARGPVMSAQQQQQAGGRSTQQQRPQQQQQQPPQQQ